jgi:hypothetical protein
LLAFVEKTTAHIMSVIDLMGEQYRPCEDLLMFSDETNLRILEQITLSVIDIRVMIEWFLKNFQTVRVDDEYSNQTLFDEGFDPGDDVTIN